MGPLALVIFALLPPAKVLPKTPRTVYHYPASLEPPEEDALSTAVGALHGLPRDRATETSLRLLAAAPLVLLAYAMRAKPSPTSPSPSSTTRARAADITPISRPRPTSFLKELRAFEEQVELELRLVGKTA